MKNVIRQFQRSLQRRGPVGTALFVPLAACRLTRASIVRWSPSAIRNRRDDEEFDRKLGIDTTGLVDLHRVEIESENRLHGNGYQATPRTLFRSLIDELPIDAHDFTFVDLGSGKGRTLILAAEHPFDRIVGVEFSPELHAIAVANLQALPRDWPRQCNHIEPQCQDATEFVWPPIPLVVYLYNPFDERVMDGVVRNLVDALDEQPRECFVVYYEPLCTGPIVDSGRFLEFRSGTDWAIFRFETNVSGSRVPEPVGAAGGSGAVD